MSKDRLAAVEEMKDKAVGVDVQTLELQVLKAKESLADLRLDLAEAEMQLATAHFTIDGSIEQMRDLADAKVAVAKAEFNKATAQLELALMRSYASEGDEKARCQECVQNYRENVRIATENLSFVHDEKTKILKLRQGCICSTHVESPAEGLKRKADDGGGAGSSKVPRTGSQSKRDNFPAWQWRHSDGTWMNYTDADRRGPK